VAAPKPLETPPTSTTPARIIRGPDCKPICVPCPPSPVVHGCDGWPTSGDLKVTVFSNYASINNTTWQAQFDAAGWEFDFRCPKPRWSTNFTGAPPAGIQIPTNFPGGSTCSSRGFTILLDCKAISNGTAVDPIEGDGKIWLLDGLGLHAPWNGPEMLGLASGGCLARVQLYIESNSPFVARSGVFYHMCESTLDPTQETKPCEGGVVAGAYCPGCTTYSGAAYTSACIVPSANALAVQVLIETWP
jgi:hypothetical protein